LTAIQAGIICLATLYAAYLAEIDRAALEAIPRQQREAAASLGLTPFQTFRLVVLPQAFRIMLPPTTNMFAGMVMDTSLVAIIGVDELLRVVRSGASDTFRSMEFYTAGALIYLALVLAITWLSRRVEARVQLDVPTRVGRMLPSTSALRRYTS
jgi:ABC-type amino acid transport system permease subunit